MIFAASKTSYGSIMPTLEHLRSDINSSNWDLPSLPIQLGSIVKISSAEEPP